MLKTSAEGRVTYLERGKSLERGLVMFILFLVAALQANMEALIKGLGDDEFSTRQNAQAELAQKINVRIYRSLKNHKETDPEIISRIKVITETYEKNLLLCYKIDLKGYGGYPYIDEGMPINYQWNGLYKIALVELYLRYARYIDGVGNGLDYAHYRKATELWMQDRLYCDLITLLQNSSTEKQFHENMNCRINAIHKDLEMLKEGDDKYWAKLKKQNPLRMMKK